MHEYLKGGFIMRHDSTNVHIGAANDRRPVNAKNVKKRRAQHQAVIKFLQKRAELDKAGK